MGRGRTARTACCSYYLRTGLLLTNQVGAGAYGADSLLQLLKNYSRSFNIKTAITVGIVGYPNVG